MSCLVSFPLPFFTDLSFFVFLVGVVPLPTAIGNDGALIPAIKKHLCNKVRKKSKVKSKVDLF